MNFINEKNIGAMYAPRIKTDELLEAECGSFSYSGVYDSAVRFVQEHQSKNTALWVTFVEQFKLQVDSESGGWSGEFYGKMMRGACWIYKYTGDAQLYQTLEATVRYLLSAREENGRISSYKQDKEFTYWDMWCRKYVLLGTQYFYEICKDEALKSEIIETLDAHLRYIMAHVGPGEDKLGILDTTTHNPETWGALNSSSILEPVVRQYYLTGNEEYLDFAKYVVSEGGSKWGNIYTLAVEGKKAPFEYPVRKAYESISFFEGVLEYYRASGDEDAKRAFINFMSRVVETDLTIIGCSGCTHELFDNSSIVQTEVNSEVKQETCVTVTLMKAFYQALSLTGEAKYADAMERSGYNAMLGAINFNKNTSPATDRPELYMSNFLAVNPFVKLMEGYTFDSYSPLYKDKRNRLVGGFRRMPGDKSYGCCACIGATGVAVMPLSSVMLSRDGIRINHLMCGKVDLGELAFTVETDYPYGEEAKIKIERAPSEKFVIGIRCPAFCEGKMTVNGEYIAPDERGYVILERIFSKGDEIKIKIEKQIRVHELNGKIALTSGAVVLALDERNQNLDVKVSDTIELVEKSITPFSSREAYEITFDNGARLSFVDFASAGAEWDKTNSKITVWIDKE